MRAPKLDSQVLEVLAPRATGRDRQIEKKAERRAMNRDRDISPGDSIARLAALR